MALTKTSDLTNSIKTRYNKAYYLHASQKPGVFGQFIEWQEPYPEDGDGGSGEEYGVFGELDPADTALTEDQDVTPVALTDDNVSMTPGEYGKTIGTTKKARYQSRYNLPEVFGKVLASNRIKSIDRLMRRTIVGHGSSRPTNTIHIDASVAMTSLTGASGTDNVTFTFLQQLIAEAAAMDIEPYQGMGYICPVHPLLAADIQALTEWKTVGYYQKPDIIFGALGPAFTIAGITFVPTNMGRLYLGSGTAVQAATYLDAAAAKGATTLYVHELTGLSVGNYVTVGTLETESVSPGSNLEQVLITAASGSSGSGNITVRANGLAEDWGLRFDHAASESVVEAYNVAAMPLFGKGSFIGKFGADSGQYGLTKSKIGGLDLLDRFSYFGWYWYGGIGIITKRVVLGKVSVSGWIKGYN